MKDRPHGAPAFRAPTFADPIKSLALGWRDFAAKPLLGLYFAGFYVAAGLFMTWLTYVTGQTFWLILLVLGFPLVGVFAAIGLYETSRRLAEEQPVTFADVQSVVWTERSGQLPWAAVIVVVILLFWFFLGHMIFALFLGLSPMTNISTSLDVFLSAEGLLMIAFGTAVGAVFASIIFAASVLGIPMLLDRDVDFMTALTGSIGQVLANPAVYLAWGLFIAVVTFLAMIPAFLGLFIVMPLLGHATWHLYRRVSSAPQVS